jgi:spore coat polysaccharide biosynthesis predicted glycosyltransferase SpsG
MEEKTEEKTEEIKEQKRKLLGLFDQLQTDEEQIREVRQEMKDAIALFCEENEKKEFEPKAVKDAYKFFKKITKDKSETMDLEYQRDKIVELLVG